MTLASIVVVSLMINKRYDRVDSISCTLKDAGSSLFRPMRGSSPGRLRQYHLWRNFSLALMIVSDIQLLDKRLEGRIFEGGTKPLGFASLLRREGAFSHHPLQSYVSACLAHQYC